MGHVESKYGTQSMTNRNLADGHLYPFSGVAVAAGGSCLRDGTWRRFRVGIAAPKQRQFRKRSVVPSKTEARITRLQGLWLT